MPSHLSCASSLAAVLLVLGCGSSVEDAGAGGGGPAPIDGGTPSVVGVGGGEPGCTSNQQCIDDNGGGPFVCSRAGGEPAACVAVVTPECPQVLGGVEALADDGAIVLGMMAPLGGADGAVGQAQVQAVDLARDELIQIAGGLRVGTERVPVAFVVCDEAAATASLEHLLHTLRVPAIVGPAGNAAAVEAAGEAPANRTLLLATSADAPELAAVDDDGLAWQAASVAAHGRALAAVAERRAAQLGGAAPRLAVVVDGTPRHDVVVDAFLAALTWNGGGAEDALESGTLRVLEAGDDPAAAAAALVEHAPSIVVVSSSSPVTAIAQAVDGELAATWIAGPRPRSIDELVAVLGDRLVVVEAGPPADRTVFEVFSARFQARGDGSAPPFAAAEAYDMAYVAMLAVGAQVSGGDAPDGVAAGAIVPRLLPPGPTVAVGPDGLNEAQAALTEGGAIDLRGATGSLDADGDGTFPRSHVVACVEDGTLVASGLTVDEGGALGGTATCL